MEEYNTVSEKVTDVLTEDNPKKNKSGKKKKKKEKEQKNSLMNELVEDVLLVIFVLAAVFIIKNFVMINAIIPSASMENTIMTGDRIFGSRISYLLDDPKRGDIAIFKFPDDESELFIKRVIGLPGDKVEIRDGLIYLNDSEVPLEEDYLPETPVGDYGPYFVPDNCYFMLGDNRNYSKDSRLWENTFVTRKEILAKAVFRYFPFDSIGTIE